MGGSPRAFRYSRLGLRLGSLLTSLAVTIGCGVTTPTPTAPPLPPGTGIVVGASTAAVERIEIYYPSASSGLSVGSFISLGVFAVHSDGIYERVFSNSGVSWTSSDPAILVASPPPTSSFRAVAPGVATLTASYQGRSASMTQEIRVRQQPTYPFLEIRIPGAPSRQYSTSEARALWLQSETVFPDVTKAATWMSSDPRVATVEGGVVLATGVGTTHITASYNGVSTSYVFSVYESYPR